MNFNTASGKNSISILDHEVLTIIPVFLNKVYGYKIVVVIGHNESGVIMDKYVK